MFMGEGQRCSCTRQTTHGGLQQLFTIPNFSPFPGPMVSCTDDVRILALKEVCMCLCGFMRGVFHSTEGERR